MNKTRKIRVKMKRICEKFAHLFKAINTNNAQYQLYKHMAWRLKTIKVSHHPPKMIKYTFIIALRNLLRDKAYLLLNLLGLSIGIAGSILILLYVRHETSYDKSLSRFDQIYRITCYAKLEGRELSVALTAPPQARVFMEEFPDIVDATRIYLPDEQKVEVNQVIFHENNFFYGDSNFFNVFSFPLVKGDPSTVLQKPFSVVLTQRTADKLFGNEDPVGKNIALGNGQDEKQLYEVTGVVRDLPGNSNFRFDYLASFSSLEISRSEFWLSQMLETFIVIPEGTDPMVLESGFPQLMNKYIVPQITMLMNLKVSSFEEFRQSGNNFEYHLQPLSEIHHNTVFQFGQEQSTSKVYVYFFSIIALFLLFIACINFMNLSTARYSYRTREVGVKKVVGSSKGQLVRQFIFESVMICTLAIVVALTLVELLLPAFNNFTGKDLEVKYLSNWYTIPLLFVFTLVIGILSGSYPAFYLASFNPSKIFKAGDRNETGNHFLRSSLVVFQFAITIILLVSTFIVSSQVRYFRNKSLGFEKENVLVIDNTGDLGEQSESFRQELLDYPGVASASRSWTVPGQGYGISSAFQLEGDSALRMHSLEMIEGDYEFVTTLGIRVKEGRSFSPDFPSDVQAILINESAVRSFGLEEPVGARITHPADEEGGIDIHEVIGVVEDINYKTLHFKVEPMMISLNTNATNRYTIVRLLPGSIMEATEQIRSIWSSYLPNQPMEFFFLDESLNNQYQSEVKAGMVFFIFSILAVFVACLGLLGLSAFTAERRKKEIGIRKAHGATIPVILGIMSKEIFILVCISSAIAWPLVYLIMKRWLQNFVYQTSIHPFVFIGSTVIGLVIALAIVTFQSYRIATMNPVDSLKYE